MSIKFKVLRGAIDKDLAYFIYNYFNNKREVAKFFFKERYISPFCNDWGSWTDPMMPNTYVCYGDIVMETLLVQLKKLMEKNTGLKLMETYAFARLYKQGDILHKHRDRFSCEISTTLHLGGDASWPLFIDLSGTKGKKIKSITLKPGDMVIYKGRELDHWREAYQGTDYAQAFLHYNDITKLKDLTNKYDGRPMLGLPSFFKNRKSHLPVKGKQGPIIKDLLKLKVNNKNG